MTVSEEYFGLSKVGLVRERNEDVFEAVPEQHFYALADGMGGHVGGDIAAEETIAALCNHVRDTFSGEDQLDKVVQKLREGIEVANHEVYRLSRSRRSLRGMGSTLACLCLRDDFVVIAHVGDSRIYRFREGYLTKLTMDHSLVTQLLEARQITQEQAEDYVFKHVITQAVGTRAAVDPELQSESWRPGDLYLLCSDGLTDVVHDPEIETILRQRASLTVEEMANALCDQVYTAGAPDNITLLLVKVHG